MVWLMTDWLMVVILGRPLGRCFQSLQESGVMGVKQQFSRKTVARELNLQLQKEKYGWIIWAITMVGSMWGTGEWPLN